MGPVGLAALGIGTSVAEGGGNLIFGEIAQKQQLRGQRKALQQQNAAALDMWHKTNFGAQMEHLKNAGLNPGLIYGMKGGGGVTTGPSNAMVDAPKQQSLGIGANVAQMQKTAAEVDVLKSQAELNRTEAAKKAGVDTELATSQIELLKKQATTEEQKALLTEWQSEIAKWDATIKMNSWEDNVTMVQRELEILESKADKELKDRAIRNGFWDEYVSAARAEMASKILENEATKAGIALTGAQITKIQQDIQTAWFNAWTGRFAHRLNVSSKEWEMLMKDVKDSTRLSVETIKGILQPLIFGATK